MTHGSLFSGIGGFDLAATWMGWENAFHCEIDGFCTRNLKYYFTVSEHYDDIKNTDFTKWRGRIDVLSGGFPCQPFSVAGRRKGADDDRYLWPEMLRAIREIQPAWVVGENVAGILTMVQPGSETEVGGEATLFGESYAEVEMRQQYVVETICQDLEREGYSVQPFVIPACAVGAPHRRDRIWFIAKRADAGSETVQCKREDRFLSSGAASHSSGERLERSVSQYTVLLAKYFCRFPTQSPVCGRDDGISCRLDGITFPKWRSESIKAYGNAVVPQVVYEIFKAIESYERA